MTKFSCTLFSTAMLLAQGSGPSNLSVVQTTATQALITFTAPSAPVVEISEKPDFFTLTNDSNPALFSQANLASKPGSIQSGNSYAYVAGKRGTDLATDGRYYSRALKAATLYYARVYPSGNIGAAVSTTFTTGTIPFGLGYIEGMEIDPTRVGFVKYPTLSWTDRTQRIVEPRTGLDLARLTLPSDNGDFGSMPLSIVFNSPEWVTPANIFTTSTAYSTISGTTNKIFLTTPPIAKFHFDGAAYGAGDSRFFSSFKVTLSALASAGAVGDAAKLQACLTQNGASCYPGATIYDSNALTTTASVVTFGTDGYGDLWQSTPGTSTPDYTAQTPVGGNLTCDGTTTVINPTYVFPFFMEQGSNILINGLNYKLVDSTNNASRLTLTAACPAGTYAYTTYNFGVLVWKKTASSDTISINSANVNAGMGGWQQQGVDGGIKTCSDNTVTPPGGNIGRICGTGFGGAYSNAYFIDSITGLAKLIEGNLFYTGPSQTGTFYNLDPTEKYGITNRPVAGTSVGGLIRVKYFGAFNDLNTTGFVWSASTGSQIAGIAQCSGTSPYTAIQPCEEFTAATGSLTMGSLVAAFTTNPAYAPAFDPAVFSNLNMQDTDADGNINLVAGFGQYRPAWQIIFNPRATSNSEGGDWNGIAGNHGCVGGGSKGCVMAAMPDWARKNCRWCGTKDTTFGGTGWLNVQGYVLDSGGSAGGPWTIQAINGTADGSSNVLDGTTSLKDCPANSYGAQTTVGSLACSQMTFSAEPVFAGTSPPGPLGTVQPGDYFLPMANIGGSGHLIDAGNFNLSRVLTKTASATAGAFVLVFQRDISQETRLPFGWGKSYGNQSLSLPQFYMYCNSLTNPGNLTGSSRENWPWATDPHGMTGVIGDLQGSKGHGAADTRGDYMEVGMAYGYGGASTPLTPGIAGNNPYTAGYTTRFANGRAFDATLSGPANYQGLQVTFGGSHASTGPSDLQSHPGPYGSSVVAANPNFDGMYMDGRPNRGGFASGSLGGTGGNADVLPQQPATKISGDLWKFAANQMVMELPYSKFYPIQGYTGRVPLLNVSGPNCSIGPTATDNYKFGIVAVAGECYLGSTVGEVYVNAPHVNPEFAGSLSAGQANTMTDHRDISIGTVSAVQNTHTQTIGDTTEHVFGSSTPQLNGTNSRTLIRVGERVNNVFMSPVMTPDNKFAILEHHLPPGGIPQSLWLARMPSRCAGGITNPCLDNDGVDRTNFINVPVIVPSSENSVAWVRFGTSENNTHQQAGDDGYLNCTGRQEYCTASTVGAWNATNPFWMETSEAGSMTPVDVSSVGATIRVPGFPSHVIYYQIVYRDKTSGALTLMPLAVAATP